MMLSHSSSTLSVQDTTGSCISMTSTYSEQQLKEARTTKTTTPGFATPISFVSSKHDTSEDLGYSPRKKLRRTFSSTDSQHLAQSSGRERNVPNLRSPASILARLDLSNVPKNEFILALPGQVDSNSNWGIEYARPLMRRSNAVVSKCDTGATQAWIPSTAFSSTAQLSVAWRRVSHSSILDLQDLDEDFSQEGISNVCGSGWSPEQN
jgi:hypothetical protein